MIAWTIEAAEKSKYIDTIVVTTNDHEIAEIALQYDIDCLTRPEHLASDTAKMRQVIEHVISYYKNYDVIILLQPTSPLRTTYDVDRALKLFINSGFDSMVSVNKYHQHNGALYILWIDHVSDIDTCEASCMFQMPNDRSVDVDTIKDFELAEKYLKRRLVE